MKVLITGFDPFGGESVNPALEAVKQLPDTIAGAEVIKLEIPTVFRKSLEKIEENIVKHNPDIVISVGQAGGRFDVTPERVAINMYMIYKKYPNIKGGFIHVPYIPSQVVCKPNTPSMAAADITKGLELCIKAAVENKEDIKAVGGEIC